MVIARSRRSSLRFTPEARRASSKNHPTVRAGFREP